MKAHGPGGQCCDFKPPTVTPASYIGVLVQVLSAPLEIQFPAIVCEKAAEDVPSAWFLATHVGGSDGVPGCGCLGSEPVNR